MVLNMSKNYVKMSLQVSLQVSKNALLSTKKAAPKPITT